MLFYKKKNVFIKVHLESPLDIRFPVLWKHISKRKFNAVQMKFFSHDYLI